MRVVFKGPRSGRPQRNTGTQAISSAASCFLQGQSRHTGKEGGGERRRERRGQREGMEGSCTEKSTLVPVLRVQPDPAKHDIHFLTYMGHTTQLEKFQENELHQKPAGGISKLECSWPHKLKTSKLLRHSPT